MPQLFTNNARASLVSGVTETDTTLTIEAGKADLFPSANVGTGAVPSTLDWFKVVLKDTAGNVEIVYVRSRTLGSGVLSNVMRGQEGTTARAFSSGTVVGLRITAADFQSALNAETSVVTTSRIADGAVTSAKLGNGAVTTAKIPDAAITLAKLASGVMAWANIANRPTALSAFTNDPGFAKTSEIIPTITAAAVGAIGTYAFCLSYVAVSPGSTVSYTNLLYANSYEDSGDLVAAGTWQSRGSAKAGQITLFLRIA